ncbi:MAG: hypothetical protein LBL47_04475 [Lactobacillus sp.]|jgi:hypothetical protein|nr:hypothetical protein [Lactobacillus sp.]
MFYKYATEQDFEVYLNNVRSEQKTEDIKSFLRLEINSDNKTWLTRGCKRILSVIESLEQEGYDTEKLKEDGMNKTQSVLDYFQIKKEGIPV